ncbi:centrosome-associated protein ALMS1 isoform X3 [Rhinolophus sinicus]|uniref:centrosome-associated protein ALMS1 isoform X3 n=1 Tax=Rhinolophus sinicus TaxID=89399 RepID=UPI003D7917A8
MEPEDLPWPGELEEEAEGAEVTEEVAEETEEAEVPEEAESLDEDEVVMVEDVEDEEGRDLDADLNYESQPRESTDDEEDEEAEAWLQAHPGRPLPLPSFAQYRYFEGERTGLEKRTESWHFLPQEIDSSHTSDTTQTRINMREERTEVTDFPSVEEGILTQAENRVKEPSRGLFCSPLLVIQDSFASPDLPLLTCLTEDQEFGPDSLFHQSELDFAPLRGIPGKSEDIEWFSRPSEVSEALFQATSEVASDFGNSRFSVSQHPLIGSTAIESQDSFLPREQGTKEETISSDTADKLKTPKDSDSYDALCSYMSWKTQEVTQEPETNLAVGKTESVPALDLAEKVGSSNIYPLKASTSDSLFVQDLKQQTFEEVADSSSCISEGLQGKAESDTCTLGDDTECCGLDENAVICSEGVAELQREICDQSDLTGECIELAGLENLLDDLEICDSSLHWQSALQLPSKEDSCFEEPVGHSNMDINQSFSSVLPPFVPHEPTGESEYHTSDLRMLRISPETVPKTLKHLSGDTSKGGITEITQSNLKPGITTTPGDSDVRSHLPSSPEDFPQLVVRSSVENTIGQHIDTLNQQILTGGHVTEETLNVLAVPKLADQNVGIATIPPSSYSQRKKPDIFYAEALGNIYQTEETLRVLAVPGPADQKTEKTTAPSSSYREKHIVFSQQRLPGSHLNEQALKVSSVSGPADQTTGIPTVSSASYLHGEKPHIFYLQTVPESHLTEEALKVSAAPGFTDQKTGIPTVTPTPYSHREKPSIFYQQQLPDSHPAEQSEKVTAIPGPAHQKTGIPTITSASFSHGEQPSVFYQQELPDGQLTDQSQQVLAVSAPAHQKTGIPTETSVSFSHREQPSIFYQQESPDNHPTEQSEKVTDVPGPAHQKTGIRTVTSAFSHGEKPHIFFQQTLPESHLTQQSQQVSAVSGFADQKTGIPTVTSASYSRREQPSIFYQQELPDSQLTDQSQEVSAVSGFADKKTGIPTVISTPYSHRERPHIFFQQTLPESHLTEQPQQVSAVHGFTDEKTGIPTVTSTPYSHREKPSIFYQQEFPVSHLTKETLNTTAVSGPAHQKTGISIAPPTSYSHREKPVIFYQQEFPDSHLTEEALQVSAVPGPAEQNTGVPTGFSGSYSFEEKPSNLNQQTLSDSHLTEEALRVSSTPRPADQTTGILTVPSSFNSHKEKPNVFYQQELPDSRLTEQAQKVSAVPGSAEPKTGIPTVTSTSYSYREKPFLFYPQDLPDSHLPEEVLRVTTVPGPDDQKTGFPPEPSSFYAHREKPIIFYPQALPDIHLTEEVLKVSTISGPADQKTGIPTLPSISYPHREKHITVSAPSSPDSHLLEEVPKVTAVPGPADQKTELPSEPSSSYAHREKPIIFYPQGLTESHIPEEALRTSGVRGPADQKAELPSEPSSTDSHREKPIVFYPQGLTGSHVPEEVLRTSGVRGPADQKTELPSEPSSSYAHREKPIVFYPQGLTGSHVPEEVLRTSGVRGPADQKTELPSEPSSSYAHREKPIVFYPQGLTESQVPEQVLRTSGVRGPADQKTELPSEPSSSYAHREKPIVFYPQGLTESQVPEEALRTSGVRGPADQKTELPSEPSSSYAHREKPIIFYPQGLTESQVPEEALRTSGVRGPVDQKAELPSEPSSSDSHREKPSIFYQQELPDSHLTEEVLKVSAGTGNQKTGIPTLPSSSYSLGGKPIIFYHQTLANRHLTEEALNVSASGPAEQKTGIPTMSSTSYSHREQPFIFYPQALPDSQLTEEALKVSAVPGPADQKTGTPTVPSSSYSFREKPTISYQQELPDLTQGTLKVLGVPKPADQKTGIPVVTSTSYSPREKPIISYQQELPDPNQDALKVLVVPRPVDQNGIRIVPSSHSHRESTISSYQKELSDITEETLKISAIPGPADQKTGVPAASSSFYSHKEKPKISTVIGSDDQKTPLLTVLPNSNSQRVKPSIFFKQHLPGRHYNEDIPKTSSVPEPTSVNSGIPIPLSSSYSHREKFSQELPDKHLTEDALKVSKIPGPADQTTVLTTAPPSVFSHIEKPDTFYQQGLPDGHLTEDALKFSSGRGQAEQITGSSTAPPAAYSHSEKHKLVSGHVQKLIDNLDSSNSSIISNNMPLNSQADGRVVINQPEPSDFDNVGSEEFQDTDSDSKTLKAIRTLLMEAENIALKRRNFPALVPFRDVSDVSFVQSKKVVCFKEPPTADESNVDLLQRQPFTEESPSNKCIQKDISTQTNLKCQRGIENWEFIPSATVRSPLQEAESQARVALDENLRQHKAAKSVMRSEPEGCSGTVRNKILIPMMTIIKSDSSSDASSCSWDSNSLESVSDVLLNFFPCASPKTSMTDSREDEGTSESDDGGGSSVDSLAAHVKNLLQCESSLNHAKQILRNAEEEECRVRARAWNLKFNMARECGYSISELNEDDRRKVEEIKAKLFGHGRTTDLSKGLQSPQEVGCKPEAVCSHIIIESHEKGCFRTLTAEQPQLDSHPCVFRSAEPLDVLRGQQSPSSWRTRHINLSKSLDQSNPHFEVWNSLQLQSHSPFQNFTADDFKISKGFQMPFREKMDPWLSELVEPVCVQPEEMDCHSSSQMLPPESMKKFTTSITFSSHRHSKCFSDSSVLKVGVTEDTQCTGAPVGVFNSHFTEEQNPPRDIKQKTSSPSSFKIISHSPDEAVTILAENSRQGQKLSVEHSHQEEKHLERPDFKGSHSVPSTSTNCSKFKDIHFCENHTLINMDRPSSTLGVKEKNVSITPNPPSHILLEQQELFEQSKAPHADHHVRKHQSPPPQHQDYVASNLPDRIFLEKRELFEQSKAPDVDHQMRENHSPLPQGQNYIAPDLPSSIFLEQRQLFEQSKAPDVDHHMRKQYSPLPQGQDCVVENNDQHKPKSHISNMIDVEAKLNKMVSQSAPNQSTLATSPPTPPSNRKALSFVHITLAPKTPSKLDSGTLDERFVSLDPASKTRMNSEFNSDLQTISSRSLKPTSKLLTVKPVVQDQESLGFLGPKSSSDFQVVQSPLPDSNAVTQDLKTIPFQNSQIVVTSRQTQVNFSDLEGYPNPEGTPVSADRSLEEIKPPSCAFSGKLSSDAVTQITTESPEKTMFSSEIFINAEDDGHEIPEPSTQKLGKVPVKFVSSSSVQQITFPRGTEGAQPSLLPYKPSGSTKMYYVPQLSQTPSFLDSKSDTTIESSHSGSNDAIAPDFPAQVLGTRDDDLTLTVNIKHKEGIYSKRAVTKASLSTGKKSLQKDNAGDAIISGSQVQVLITGDENLSDKNQKKEIYSKNAVTNTAQPEEKESFQKDTADSSDAAAAEHSAQLQDTKIESPSDTKAIKQKEEIHRKSTVPKEAWSEDKESLQIDMEESRRHSQFENTTHSVFRSAKFYFHHPVHLPTDQDICHESSGRSVFVRHSWKDLFQHHPDKQREYTCLPSPHQNEEKTKTDFTRIESLSINVNLENKETIHPTKTQTRDYAKCDKPMNEPKKNDKVPPEPTTQHTASLNELWNKYRERQKQQKPPGFSDRKELSLVERLDRLAKLLQNPITHSLQPSESTQDDSRGERDAKEWSGRQQQQKNKLHKKKRYKSLEKCHKNIGDLKKSKVLSTHQAGRSNHIKIEQVKFDKYVLRKQPGFHYLNNTSSDSRPSEDSELLTDTATNILSSTTSAVESDILTQTDREVTVHERSSSISTIDTARLIRAFGHERVCLSPRRINLYSSITDHQRRFIEKRSKNMKRALNTGYPQMTCEHTRRKHIQGICVQLEHLPFSWATYYRSPFSEILVANHVISSDSISSSTSSFWSSSSTLYNNQNVHMLNKGVQAGNLEIVNGVKKHTRDVGMTFPTPSSSETRVEEDSDVTSWSEEKIEEKRLLTSYLKDKKLKKNKQSCCEGVSWFVPVENVKFGPKKENLPKLYGPGISWFAPVTNTKPWREPLREQNWQGQHVDSHGSPAGPGRGPLKPFVRVTLQESLQLHRPDFISRSGERIKRLKLIVQERKLQNMLQSEREALFNTVREWQGYRHPIRPLPKTGFMSSFQKYRKREKKRRGDRNISRTGCEPSSIKRK